MILVRNIKTLALSALAAVFCISTVQAGGNKCKKVSPDLGPAGVAICSDKEDVYFSANFLNGYRIVATPDSLEEVNSKGKVVRKMKTKAKKDNSWTYMEEYGEDSGIFTSNLTNYKGDDSGWVRHITHFGTLTSVTTQNWVACSGCTNGTSGECQNVRNLRCRAPVGFESCPARHNPCSSTITSQKDLLSFSLAVTKWDFQNPANSLRYRIALRVIKDGKDSPKLSKEEKRSFLEDSGLLSMPTFAWIVTTGEWNTHDVDVDVTTTFGDVTYIEITLPSFPAGTLLHYFDPDLGLGAEQIYRDGFNSRIEPKHPPKPWSADAVSKRLSKLNPVDIGIAVAPESGRSAVLFTWEGGIAEFIEVCKSYSGVSPSGVGGDGSWAADGSAGSMMCFPPNENIDESWAGELNAPTSLCGSGRVEFEGRVRANYSGGSLQVRCQ